MSYAVLVVNGSIKDISFYEEIFKNAKLIVASDGAGDILKKYNKDIDYLIGDMDSISLDTLSYYKDKGSNIIKYPVKKDKTDSHLCIDKIKEQNINKIIMIGALGDRIDHFLSNINLLYYADSLDISLKIVDENNEIILLNKKENYIEAKIGQTISFVSISGNVTGITLKGFEYEICDYDLDFGSSILTSNIAKKEKVYVNIKKGSLLCIKINNV